MTTYQTWLSAEIAAAVETWWRLACSGHTQIYLIYRPTGDDGSAGALDCISSEQSMLPGWEVADPRRLVPSATREQTTHTIAGVARRLPILSTREES